MTEMSCLSKQPSLHVNGFPCNKKFKILVFSYTHIHFLLHKIGVVCCVTFVWFFKYQILGHFIYLHYMDSRDGFHYLFIKIFHFHFWEE